MTKTESQPRQVLFKREVVVQELLSVALLVIGVAAAVALGADRMVALALGVGVYATWHLAQALRLLRSLFTSHRPESLWAWGVWRGAFDQLRRLRKRENKRRRRQQKVLTRIRKMAGAMPDALLTLGSAGEISWMNRQAEAFFGLAGDSVLGRRLVDLVEHPVLRDYLQASRFKRELEIEAPGDPTLMLSINVARFRKGRERYLLVARDITRQYHLNRTQRDFTLNVSHELKTPLTVLRGYLETMAEAEEPRSSKRLPLLRMHEQVSRMQGVIVDLITLSRLEYGSETLRRDPVQVLDVLEDVVRGVRTMAEDSHHVLDLSGDPDLLVKGDASLLHCAFSNLVSNAVRHTPSRTRIEISLTGKGDRAELAVHDNGEGIPARHLPRLTERFYRVDAGRSRDAGGTGLGLAIVRQILDMHGARLSISSEEGRGSDFACIFPAEMVHSIPNERRVGRAS